MKRKIFTSLLVAPLALNALADATVNDNLVGDGTSIWKPSGISDTTNLFGDNNANCTVAGGSIERILQNLNPGTYKIEFGTQDNVKVLVNGAEVTLENNVATFKVEQTGNVTLRITSGQASKGFSFSDAKLILDFDFVGVMNGLNTSLADVTLSEVPADDLIPENYRQEAASFRTRRANLETTKDVLQTDINKLGATDDKELLNIYNQYKLWENPNTLKTKLTDLSTDASAFNKELADAVEKWNQVNANQSALDVLNTQIDELQALINAAKSKVEGVTNNPNVKGSKNDAKTYIASKVLSKEAQESLNDYKAAVETAYSDLEKAGIVNPDGYTEVKSECDALMGQFATALETWNAYYDVTQLQSQVVAELSKNLAAIDALSGVKGKENNFDDYKETVKTQLNDIYADAISKLAIKLNATTIDDKYTIENSVADTKILNGALVDMEMMVENATSYVFEQNKLYTDYNLKLKEDRTNLANCKDIDGLPEEQQTELGNLRTAAQDAIDALGNTIYDAYVAAGDADSETQGLDADAYATEFSDIDAKVKAVSDYLAQWQPIVNIINNFDDLKKYIKGLQTDSKIPVDEFDLLGKFQNNIDNIDAAIEDLKQHPDADDIDTRLEQTQQAIDQTKTYAKDMMDAYVAAAAAVKDFRGKMTELDGYIAAKSATIVKGNNYDPQSFKTTGSYTQLEGDCTDFEKTLTAIQQGKVETGDISNQEVYNKAIKLAEDIKNYGVETQYNSVLNSFETEATERNFTYVSNAIGNVKKEQAEGEYAGKEDVSFTEVDNELSGIRTNLDNAESQDVPSVPAFKKVDEDLIALMVKVNALKQTVQDLKDNQAAYDDLIGQYNDADFSEQIKKLLIYNQDNSLAPAVDYFNALIGSGTSHPEGSLYAKNEDLKKSIDDALADRTACKNKTDLEKSISNLKTAITNMYVAIDDNNAAYKGQMAESDLVRSTIDGILETLQKADETAGKDLTADWQNKLNELRNTNLTAVDVDANRYYGQGLSKTYDKGENIGGEEGVNGIINRYDEILKKANDIQNEFNNQYGDRVKTTNEATVSDAQWKTDLTSMMNKYEAAIQQYNAFYLLDNENYRIYILEVVGTHKVIFDYYKAIKDVETKVQAWIQSQNDAKIAFTSEAFNTACVDVVNEVLAKIAGAAVDTQPADPTALKVMTASIDNRVENMLADANAAAKEYYNGNGADLQGIHTVAEKCVDDAEAVLNDANVGLEFSKELTDAKKNLKDGEGLYAVKNEDQTFALDPMNDIANWFEIIPNPIDLQPAAFAQWNKYYEDASATLATLKQTLADLAGHNPDVETILEDKVTAASKLNTEAVAEKSLIDSIVTYKSQLDKILEEADQIVSEEEKRVNADVENTQLAEQYAATLADLNKELDALKSYAASMIGGQGMTFVNISSLISAYNTLVTVTYPHELKAHEQEITGAIQDVRYAIANGYTGVRTNESVALNNLLDMVKVAFNNAVVAGDCTLSKEQLAEINAGVETLKPKVYGLPGIEDDTEFQESALALETALSDYYVQLKESYDDKVNEATTLLAALEGRYGTIAGNITAGLDALSEGGYQSVIEEYNDDYTNLKAALDKLKTEWTADGNKIVMTAAGYNTELDTIQIQLDALNETVAQAKKDAQAEQDRINANNEAHVRLAGELNGLKEKFDAVKEIIEEYGLTEDLQHDIDVVQSLLTQAETALEADFSDVKLTADSKLKDEDAINSALTNLNVRAEQMNCSSIIKAALDALDEANDEIGKKVVPEIKEQLLDQYNTLSGNYSQGYNDYQNGILGYNEGAIEAEELISTFKKINAVMDDIIAKAGEIKTTAEENIFVPGNVDLDAEGVVNSADLQTLIGWIGHGVTYEELYAESPRKAAAANIVGDDVINIADATALVQIIIDEDRTQTEPAAVPRRLAYRCGVQASESIYGVALMSNEHGSRQYAITIDNNESFIGGQLDVKLPSGMILSDVQATDRAAGHEVMVFDNGNGWYRIILISSDNAEITGNSGSLLLLSTEGVGTPTVEGVVFSDTENTAVSLKQSSQSMIDTVMDYTRNGIDRIYNAVGQTMRSIQNGINIIVHSNGKTTKELRK